MPVNAINLSQTRLGINAVLTTHAQGYVNSDFVWNALFPAVPVGVSGGQILEFGKEAFKAYNTGRAPGSATKRIAFGYLGKPYALLNKGLEAPVPDEFNRDAKVVPGIELSTRAINLVSRVLALELEIEAAALALNASLYDSNHKIALTGTSKWSDPTSNPGLQIDQYKEAIRGSVGMYPNTLVLSALAFTAVKNNPYVLQRFQYTSSDSITPMMLANYFGLKKVEVGAAVSADDAGVMGDIWGNNAVLAYVPLAPSMMEEPSYGYTYTMLGNPAVRNAYRDENARSWVYGMDYERAPVQSGITSGFLIQNPN